MNPIYWFLRLLCIAGFKLGGNLRIYGRNNLVEDRGALFAANHVSYLDPPLVGVVARGPLYYLARKSLFDERPLGWVLPHLNLVPVDSGGRDMSAIKKIVQLVSEGKRVAIFPEGTRSPDGSLQPAQAGVGLVIAKTLAPVVPMRVFGTWESFPRGAKKIKRHQMVVVVGKPLIFTETDFKAGGRDAYQKAADRVMAAIAALEVPNES
jgi:1-acyl-sn-glycerol-3-phosphate acyltransferase